MSRHALRRKASRDQASASGSQASKPHEVGIFRQLLFLMALLAIDVAASLAIYWRVQHVVSAICYPEDDYCMSQSYFTAGDAAACVFMMLLAVMRLLVWLPGVVRAVSLIWVGRAPENEVSRLSFENNVRSGWHVTAGIALLSGIVFAFVFGHVLFF